MTHAEAFQRFHAENPHVYERLKRLAFRLKVRGVERYGMKALWEVLRYEEAVATTAPAGSYRLNNNFTARYARLLMELEPDLHGFFELRERRANAAALRC
jgi:hypothetical protein